VLIGQFIGMTLLIGVSIIAALASILIPSSYIGLLGLAPISIGLYKLYEMFNAPNKGAENELKSGGAGVGNVISVLSVTVANGGDNIGVYAPVFALQQHESLIYIAAIFALMTCVWCAVSFWMVNHPTIGAPIRKYGQRILPFILIAIGFMVLHEANTLDLFFKSKGAFERSVHPFSINTGFVKA
jgi:Predicted permease, cadmium resistance protein